MSILNLTTQAGAWAMCSTVLSNMHTYAGLGKLKKLPRDQGFVNNTKKIRVGAPIDTK